MQLAHAVVGGHLIVLIKAWTTPSGLKDQDILTLAGRTEPPWPSAEQLQHRLQEALR